MGEENGTSSPREVAPAPDADPVAALEARLGVGLADHQAALAALTHKSYVNEHRDEAGLADNERLEFLGDAVIDLAVSHRLMERFPGAREGELSKMRAAVVDEQGLSGMARALDLGALLRLGRGEELTGGRQKASLLADAMEAVVAAAWLGGGLPPVLAIIDRFLGEAFARATAGTLDRDFKTQLQELAQSRLRATPRYRVVAEHGPDHCKIFEVETDLRGEVLGRGAGRSKKDAEQAAARLALEALVRRFGEEPSGPAPAAATPAPAPPGPQAAGDGPTAPEEVAPAPAEVTPATPAVARPAPATPAAGETAPETAAEAAPGPRRTPSRRATAKRPRRAAHPRKARPAHPRKTSAARPRKAARASRKGSRPKR